MTDNKLTLQDCFKYPNAKILDYTGSKDNPNDYRNIYDYIYKQGQLDGMNLEEITEDIFNDYFICNCKLILRDITQLTDEEKEYIVENYLCFSENRKTFNYGVEYLFNCSFNETTNYSVELADYLRSKNILVEPKDWFKQGKAVKG